MLSMKASAAPAMFPLAPPPPPPRVVQLLPLPPPAAPYNKYNHAVAAPPVLGVQIRQVTAANYEAELDAIGSLLARYPFVAIDQSRARGVASAAFAAKLAAILSSRRGRGELTWAAFGGAYDFAYLVKMLAGGRPLPGTWHEFVAQARALLGGRLFDAKYMAEHCECADLCGGLRRVAARLSVQRRDSPEPPPPACLAGGKSHSACRIYTAMRRRILYRDGGASHQGLIDGLHH
ncbi:putative CCR4-associated factor 1 homolog 3 [Panicum virgatum]|uniref:putative CCR4-associated factor 1 homolog 3 n=1 Tax=Panicum virgatum TaxID=38727 RepID=UPI0019D56C7D|nr:putative CCR4-associated factor 1 homolog 3 [Panicum virgatum]